MDEAEKKFKEANKARDAMACLHLFLDSLREKIDSQLLRVVVDFEHLQRSWGERSIAELNANVAPLEIVKPHYEILTQLHTMQQAAQRECERLAGENKILKRAVAIQNEKLEGAQEQMRQLQHKNYALAVHLQPSSAVSSPIAQNPRWLS